MLAKLTLAFFAVECFSVIFVMIIVRDSQMVISDVLDGRGSVFLCAHLILRSIQYEYK